MNKSLSVTAKLTILLVLALAFAATLIGLSARTPRSDYDDASILGDTFGKDTKRIEKKFVVQSGGQLHVEADEGDLSITGTDADEVSVVVTAHGSSDRLRKYHVDFNQDGNSVKVEGREERPGFNLFYDGSFGVRYEIQVPKNFNLTLNTSGGNIIVNKVKGEIKGETSGGDVDVDNLEGLVRLSTSGGNVSIRNSNGDFVLKTSGGDIEGASVVGPLDVETSGGNIQLTDADGMVRASTSGGNIHVSVLDNKGIDLETSGGNVSVKVPVSIAASIDAETTGGDVDCNLEFSGKIKDGVMKGKINGGGNLVKLRSSGGDIVISSRE